MGQEIRMLRCEFVTAADAGFEIEPDMDYTVFEKEIGSYGSPLTLQMYVPKGTYKKGDIIRITVEKQEDTSDGV